MRLRHNRGSIPTVPSDTNTVAVYKIIKKVGLALLEHTELSEEFIQPLTSPGLFRFAEGTLLLSTKFLYNPRE